MWQVAGLLTHSPATQLKNLVSIHVPGVELRSVGGTSILDLEDRQVWELKADLDRYGLQAVALGTDLATGSVEDDYTLDRVYRATEVAGILGCQRICGYSFKIPAGHNPDRYKGEVIDRIGKIIQVVARADMSYLHENAPGYFGDVPTRVLDLVECFTEDEFSLVFDPISYLQCQVAPLGAAYTQVIGRTSYVRLHLDPGSKVLEHGKYLDDLLARLRDDSCAGIIALSGLADVKGGEELSSLAALLSR